MLHYNMLKGFPVVDTIDYWGVIVSCEKKKCCEYGAKLLTGPYYKKDKTMIYDFTAPTNATESNFEVLATAYHLIHKGTFNHSCFTM